MYIYLCTMSKLLEVKSILSYLIIICIMISTLIMTSIPSITHTTMNPHIFQMWTVMLSPGGMGTFWQCDTIFFTNNAVQPDRVQSWSKPLIWERDASMWVSELPAYHIRLTIRPTVITNCTPAIGVEDFYTSFIRKSAAQQSHWIWSNPARIKFVFFVMIY